MIDWVDGGFVFLRELDERVAQAEKVAKEYVVESGYE